MRYQPQMTFVITDDAPLPNGAHSDWLVASDKTRFRVARFHPTTPPIGTVVLLNGRTEFIEKYFEVIDDLLARNYVVATLDWRGQGLSDRALDNRHKGHVEDFDLYVSDLRQAVIEYIEPNCPGPFRLLCHSMGGNIGMRYLGEHPGQFESAVFSAPMWGIGKHARTPLWMRAVAKVTRFLKVTKPYIPGGGDFTPKDRNFEGNQLTHDPVRFKRYVSHIDKDPTLELGAPTVGWARQAIRSMDTIHSPGFVEEVIIPVVVCTAGEDALVSPDAQRLVADRLPNGKQLVIPGSKHELMVELDALRAQFFTAFDDL
jgi:lysophospholipase